MELIRIGTWNVNSIRARIDHLLELLRSNQYHTVLVQETKCTNEDFSEVRSMIEDLGYNVSYHGQKSYNGVAIMSKSRINNVETDLHEADQQARYMEAVIEDFLIMNIYLPNGNPIDSPKFTYKLDWMDSLISRVNQALNNPETKLVLAGDFNVAPMDLDCHDPKAYENDAVTQKESRSKFDAILSLGMTDILRKLNPDETIYTYWGYRGFGWQKNAGLRLDHILLSDGILNKLETAGIDPSLRGMPKASDHCVAWCDIKL